MANQKNLFNKRLNCPACEHNESTEIINLEWNDKVLTDLFRYRNYPIDFINEESYVILECLNCSLLYQKFCYFVVTLSSKVITPFCNGPIVKVSSI